MTTTRAPKRRAHIDRARARYAENPQAPFDYPALPQAEDPAYNFWCIYLGYTDGTFQRGPLPAFPIEDVPEQIVADERRPFIDPGFTLAVTEQQQNIMEQLTPKVARDEQGHPVLVPTRWWRPITNHNRRLCEDPRVAARTADPFVRKVELYCPLLDPGPLGSLQEHGPYPGAEAELLDDDDRTPGVCETCAKDPTRKVRALKKIFELYQQAQKLKVLMNPELQRRVLLQPLQPMAGVA